MWNNELTIRTMDDMVRIVEEDGILPLFTNSIPGFSLEEHVDPSVWFTEEDGPWEWKGPVIRETGCAYAKLFENKAAFVRRDLYLHLANLRRDGYDFDARFDDGMASFRDKELFELIDLRSPALSRDLKAEGGYGKEGKKGFETLVTRLQRQCYVLISDFAYDVDRHGKRYGWGIGVYSTPEKFFGPSFRREVYGCAPDESREILLDRLGEMLPHVKREKLIRFLGK